MVYNNLAELFTAIANAIRGKTGSADPIVANDFPTAIEGISGGDHSVEDGLITRKLTEYSNDRITIVGQSAFAYCTSLTSVNLPNVKTIAGTSAFDNCTSLTSVNLPNVIGIIGINAFVNCTSLTSVNLPNVDTIAGVNAFYGCTSLTSVILRKDNGMCSLRDNSVFANTPIASGTGYIYVPAALVDTYKTATNWSTYANQFRALEDYTVDGTVTGELDLTKMGL